MDAAVWDVGVTTLLHHCRRRSHGGRGDVADAAEVHRRHRALAVLQAVDRHLGDAVVVHEGAGHHEAVEYLMTVELKHAVGETVGGGKTDIEIRWYRLASNVLS